jgi:hypothetical protein
VIHTERSAGGSVGDRVKAPFLSGLVLGVLVVAWSFVVGVVGWHRDPSALLRFGIVFAMQVVVLGLTLFRTRARTYRSQVGAGLVVSAVAAVIVFVGSVGLTSRAFPSYFRDLRAARESVLREEGMSEEAITARLERLEASQTPTGHAFAAYMGTLGSGFVISIVLAALLRDRRRLDGERDRDPQAPPAAVLAGDDLSR